MSIFNERVDHGCLRYLLHLIVIFHIDNIQDIQWRDDAFDSLVLAGGYKNLIMTFVESHVENKDRFDDVIEGKGIEAFNINSFM